MAAVNPLLAKLVSAMRGEAEKPPKRHMTAAQWAKEWNIGILKAQRLLRAGVNKKLMGQKNYRVAISNGCIKPIPHYYEL